MEIDRNGMRVLDQDDCLRRLGRVGIGRLAVTVGRLAVTVGALPAVFPVNYAGHAGEVYFRTAGGTKLAAAARNAVVALEVDDFDRFAHTGWSVQVVGPAVPVESPDEVVRLRHLPLARWVAGAQDTLVRIRSDLISGREINPNATAQPAHRRDLPISNCPDCGADSLVAVSDGELTNFVCTACFACSHVELGAVYRIPATTCPGCRLVEACHAAGSGGGQR